jgi:hypothetical protein
MSADIVHIRDFKRREEREAADVRLATRVGMAELIAESVCELPKSYPDYSSVEKDLGPLPPCG